MTSSRGRSCIVPQAAPELLAALPPRASYANDAARPNDIGRGGASAIQLSARGLLAWSGSNEVQRQFLEGFDGGSPLREVCVPYVEDIVSRLTGDSW